MEEPMRIRVLFEGRHVLTQTQRSEGLKRSWVLLPPELTTVADLASHLIHSFALQRSCPHGLVLSMDGFVLPSFESTCIFKDKDIIRVTKKGGGAKEVIEMGDDGYHIQDSEIVEKQPIHSSNKLLANKEYQEDSGECKSNYEDTAYALNENTILVEALLVENTNSKRKRKHSNILQGSKRKKSKVTSRKIRDITTEDYEKSHMEQNQSCPPKRVDTHKCSHRKYVPSNGDARMDVLIASQTDDVENTPNPAPREERRKKLKVTTLESQEIVNKDPEKSHMEQNQCCPQKIVNTHKSSHRKDDPSNGDDRMYALVVSQADDVDSTLSPAPTEERHNHAETNCQRGTSEPPINGVMRKLPSRSARRKKAKRQLLLEMAKSQTNENIEIEVPNANMNRKSPETQKMDQNNETEDEIVPVIVRPGHIRFEPIDAEQSKQQSNGPVNLKTQRVIGGECETRGLYCFDSSAPVACSAKETLQWNGTTSKKKGQKWGREKTSWRSDDNAFHEESTEKFIAGNGNLVDGHTDFESLYPLSRLPKEGDVIAYRIVELTSSWCPELSPFRVGKVSSYNSISMEIVLDPVPEHPIFQGAENDEELQPDVSPYEEDGSLEIGFPSLHDIRLVKANIAEEITVDTLQRETIGKAAPVSNWKMAFANNNVQEKVSPPTGTPISNWEATLANRSVEGKVVSPNGTTIDPWELALANNGMKESIATPAEKGSDTSWEQINQALSEKKAKLMKFGSENGDPKKNTRTPWSYRALRRSAVGPTVALLRAGH